ncbi:MAG: hypothetical protein V4549_07780 [Bacteroidota bacterium]
MENLPASTNSQALTLFTNAELFDALKMANNIVQFPYPSEQIADWCRIIKEKRPDVTMDQLKTVLDKFIDGRSKWNHKESLPNIFRGIELLKINKGEFFDEEKQMKYRNYCTSPNTFVRIYENEREF